MLNIKSLQVFDTNMVNDNNNVIKIFNGINNNENSPPLTDGTAKEAGCLQAPGCGCNHKKLKYLEVVVENPLNNRDIILKITKSQKGVYIYWSSLDGKYKYVRHSINLYNRISSYFMPSILKTKAPLVLRYLNKHGFSNMKLTIYILDVKSSLEQIVELKQQFIDSLNPNLNVDLVARSSGFHQPMKAEIREKLRKQRGLPIYIYKAEDFTLLNIFESKQHMYNSINIHHDTLNTCLYTGVIYLDTFFFSFFRFNSGIT